MSPFRLEDLSVDVEGPGSTSGRIVGMSDSFKDREWVITRTPFVFGRVEGSDINLEHEVGTSRRHAEIHLLEGSRYAIVDMSSNGTMVNGVRAAKGAMHPLRHGDVIIICASVFRFMQDPVSVSAPVAVRAPDEIPALGAQDALAHAARLMEDAAKLKADAELALARARAGAEGASQENRQGAAPVKHQDDSRAALEVELARMRQMIEEEVRARAEAAALTQARAEAEARAQAQAAAEVELRSQLESQRRELERLRAESRRLAAPTAEAPNGQLEAPRASTLAAVSTEARQSGGSQPEGVKSPQGSPSPVLTSLMTTPENAAYQFNLNDEVMIVLSADNLNGETVCTPAELTSISLDGRLTLVCADPVASFWVGKTVMVGKNPVRGALLTADTRVLSTSDDSNTVVLSNTVGNPRSVQLRSSVRQRAIPETQTFSRADGKAAILVDYSIGGVAITIDKVEPGERGDVIRGRLQLKRSLMFEVALEVRGRKPDPERDDQDILSCRFSTKKMDSDVLRAISMAVLYRR